MMAYSLEMGATSGAGDGVVLLLNFSCEADLDLDRLCFLWSLDLQSRLASFPI